LGWPSITQVSSIEMRENGRVRLKRIVDEGRQTVETSLPAALSISKDIGEPRYPSFMGIRKATRAAIPTWTLADLGLASLQPSVRWPEISAPPASTVATEIISGQSPIELAESLVEKILAEKVL
jgi:electron transfer flavoprotein beta subunit